MATLKELLGEKYKPELTHEEIDAVLKEKKFADLALGNYVSIGKFKALEEEKDEINKKYLEKLSDSEKREREIEEREKFFKQLERTNNINEYSKKLSNIANEDVRNEIAELLADGKTFEAIEKQNSYQTSQETELRAKIKQELLSNNPTPPPNNGQSTITKDEIMRISDYSERQRKIEENIDLFK